MSVVGFPRPGGETMTWLPKQPGRSHGLAHEARPSTHDPGLPAPASRLGPVSDYLELLPIVALPGAVLGAMYAVALLVVEPDNWRERVQMLPLASLLFVVGVSTWVVLGIGIPFLWYEVILGA